jgi:hypothetical protein
MVSLQSIAKGRPIHWVVLSAAILIVDYATGPFIQFPILFIFPVALATAGQGRMVGATVGALLPLLRLSFYTQWPLPSSWALEILDTAIDVAILVATSLLIDRIVRQEREIRVLEGLLPICSFCKRIRDEEGEWRQMESYIAARSGARFSHTFCGDCGRRHYPELMD